MGERDCNTQKDRSGGYILPRFTFVLERAKSFFQATTSLFHLTTHVPGVIPNHPIPCKLYRPDNTT